MDQGVRAKARMPRTLLSVKRLTASNSMMSRYQKWFYTYHEKVMGRSSQNINLHINGKTSHSLKEQCCSELHNVYADDKKNCLLNYSFFLVKFDNNMNNRIHV